MTSHLGSVLADFSPRLVQVAVESSLYPLIGFLAAGALRAMARPGQVARLFRPGRWAGPASACAVALIFLPVCALDPATCAKWGG